MATAESVKTKIQSLINKSNETTGNTDTDLTSAVNRLVEGYGKGGGGDSLEGYFDGSLTEVTLPNITKIKENAFYRDTSLVNVIMPKVTTIGGSAFNGCTKLVSLKLPSGLTKIGVSAFDYCSGLTSIELPEGLKTIEYRAFQSCSGLVSLEIPSTVSFIDQEVFARCSNLTSVTFKGTPPKSAVSSNIFQYCSKIATINVPWASGAVDGAPWGATNATINYNYTGE
jgi:hypothetical protein